MEKQLLSDINVLDFSWALVGSLTTKHLGDFGATVVKVETSSRIDLLRTDRQVSISTSNNPDDKPWFNDLNTSKYGILLNLKNPKSIEIIEKLVKWADVVMENFSPGTMAKLGLDYESLKKINPKIIMASGSVYGQTGPMANEWGVDGTGNALSSRLYLTGWPDRCPVVPSGMAYGDIVLPFIIASAIIAALDYRRKTGKGQYIDASMFEVLVHQMAPANIDWQIHGKIPERNGNRSDEASPHGVFPCKGEDRWCAITIFTEAEWTGFCKAIGSPPWANEGRFSSFKDRKENEEELETLIGEWTSRNEAHEVMEILQSAGISAGAVQDSCDLLNDPQLKERKSVVDLKHPVLGEFGHMAPPYKLSRREPKLRTSPCLGEHTEYVCTQLLGLSDDEFIKYYQDCVFV
ncbi:CaiB/BaiF CoA transferase family protein [Thermodesulfobacteriota bacterium]